MSETFNRTNVEYDGRIYPAVELLNFTTADNVVVEYGVFTSEEFMNVNDDSLQYRMLDERIYGYLPKPLLEKGTEEEEVRQYIKYEIG